MDKKNSRIIAAQEKLAAANSNLNITQASRNIIPLNFSEGKYAGKKKTSAIGVFNPAYIPINKPEHSPVRVGSNLNLFGITDAGQTKASVDNLIEATKSGRPVSFKMFDIETAGDLPDIPRDGKLPDFFSIMEIGWQEGTITRNQKEWAVKALETKSSGGSQLFRPDPNSKLGKAFASAIKDLKNGVEPKITKSNPSLYNALFDLIKYSDKYKQEQKQGINFNKGIKLSKISEYIQDGYATINNEKNPIANQEEIMKWAKSIGFVDDRGLVSGRTLGRNSNNFDIPILKQMGLSFGNPNMHLDTYETKRIYNQNLAMHPGNLKDGFYKLEATLKGIQEHTALADILNQIQETGPVLDRATAMEKGQAVSKGILRGVEASPIHENNNFIITKNIQEEAVFSNPNKGAEIGKRGYNATFRGISTSVIDGKTKYIATFKTSKGQFQIIKDTHSEVIATIHSNFTQIHDDVKLAYSEAKKTFGKSTSQMVDNHLLSNNVTKINTSNGPQYFNRNKYEDVRFKLMDMSDSELKEIAYKLHVANVKNPLDLSTALANPINRNSKIGLIANAITHQRLRTNLEDVSILNHIGVTNEIKGIHEDKDSWKAFQQNLKNLNSNWQDKLIKTNEVIDQKYASMPGLDNFKPKTMTSQIRTIMDSIDTKGLGHTLYEDNGKLQLAIFTNEKANIIKNTLLKGKPISSKDAVILQIPSLDKHGTVTIGNTTKANSFRLSMNNSRQIVATTAAQDIMDQVNSKIAQIAKPLASGDAKRAQWILNSTISKAYDNLPSANRYGFKSALDKEIDNSFNASNKLASWYKNQFLDISGVLDDFTRPTTGKSFSQMHPSEAANLMRDIFRYSEKKDGGKYSNFSEEHLSQMTQAFNSIGIDKNTIDFSGIKAEAMLSKGIVSLVSSKVTTPMGFLNEAVKDNSRAMLNYLSYDPNSMVLRNGKAVKRGADHQFGSTFIGEQFDNARGSNLSFIVADDKKINYMIQSRITELEKVGKTSQANFLRSHLGNELTPSTYEGTMAFNPNFSEHLNSSKEKIFKFNPEEFTLGDKIKVGSTLGYNDPIGQADPNSKAASVLFDNRYGGYVKEIKKMDDGLVHVTTDIFTPAIDGKKINSADGSIKSTIRNYSKEFWEALLGARSKEIAGIINTPALETTNVAGAVMGSIEQITKQLKADKAYKQAELIDIINETFFKGSKIASTNGDQIQIKDIDRETYAKVFGVKYGSVNANDPYRQLGKFKDRIIEKYGDIGRSAVNSSTISFGSTKMDVINLTAQEMNLDPVAAVYGSKGKGIKLGYRDYLSYKSSDNFYGLVDKNYNKEGSTALRGAFREILDQNNDSSSLKFTSYAYGLAATQHLKDIGTSGDTVADGLASKYLGRSIEGSWFGNNQNMFKNISVYDLNRTLSDYELPNGKIVPGRSKLSSLQYGATMSSDYTGSLTKDAIKGTLLDDKMYNGKAGIFFRLPEALNVKNGDKNISEIFIPRPSDEIRVGGAYMPDRVTQAADRIIRHTENYNAAIAKGYSGVEEMEKLTRAVPSYFQTLNEDFSGNKGSVMEAAFSGRVNHSSSLITTGMNIDSYKGLVEQYANNGKTFENAAYLSKDNIRAMLDGANEERLNTLFTHMNGGQALENGKVAGIDNILHIMEQNGAELPSMGLRYPNIGRGSMQSEVIRLGKDGQVGNSNMLVTLGSHIRKGGDYDGDTGVQFLPYLNDKISNKEVANVLKTMEQQRKIEAEISTKAGFWALDKFNKSSSALESATVGDLYELGDFLHSGTKSQRLVDKFGEQNWGTLTKDYLSAVGDHAGRFGKKALDTEFEARAQKIIGGASNISLVYRNLANSIGENSQSDAGKLLSTIMDYSSQAIEQASISSKHIGKSTSEVGELVTASSDLQKHLRFLGFQRGETQGGAEKAMEAMDRLGVFDQGGNFVKSNHIEMGESLRMIREATGISRDGVSDKTLFYDSLTLIRQLMGQGGQGTSPTSGAFAKYGVSSSFEGDIDSIKNTLGLFQESLTKQELVPIAGDLAKRSGIELEQGKLGTILDNISNGIKAEGKYTPTTMGEYFDEAANTINTSLKKPRTPSEAFDFGMLKKAAPYAAIAAGILGITGAMSRPSVKRNKIETAPDQAPSSDGQYVDPLIQNTLAQSAPLGSGPTARVTPDGTGYQKINVKINGNAIRGLTSQEMSGIIEEEIQRQTALPINLNITSRDDKTTMDRSWVQNEFLKSIRKG